MIARPLQYFGSVNVLASFLSWSNQGEFRMRFGSIYFPIVASRSGFLWKLQSMESHSEAMKKFAASSVLLSGIDSLEIETAKKAIVGLHN
jgi:hypothetical protein